MRCFVLRKLSCILWLSAVLATPSVVHAQLTGTISGDIDKPILKDEQQVASWRREGHIELVSVISVIALGAIISALQGAKSKWVKTMSLVLGAGVATLTAVNARVFTADDRSLKQAAVEGDGIISQLWFFSDRMKDEHVSEQERVNFQGSYYKKLLEFEAIGERLNGTTHTTNMTGRVEGAFRTVYAQSKVAIPEWVEKLPSDKISLYFVGKAYDASFTNAKQNSLNDAVHSALLALKPQAPGAQDDAIIALIKASAVIQDSAFTYDQNTRKYTYYTLLRLSREIQSIGLRSLPSTKVVQFPTVKFQQSGWQPADMVLNPSSGIFVLDTSDGVSKLVGDQQTSPRIEKLFGLKGSYQGAALAANAESVFVASNSKVGCTVHKYSLANKAVSRRLLSQKERCAGIAVDGNMLYLTMPDRKEIRYWDRWDSPSAHSWSMPEGSSLGYLTFDAKGHRLIAADDLGKLYEISVPDGKAQLLASNVGFVNSIATSEFHILVASGDKVLFLARSDNRGENPPAGLQSLMGGRIVGVGVDASDKLWLADYDNKVVEGPFPLT